MLLRQILCAGAVSVALSPSAVGGACVDVSLVLAVDASSSIDDADFALQQQGYAAAFHDPAVHQALAAAGIVEVAVFFWSSAEHEIQVLPWHTLRLARDADDFAARILAMPRLTRGETHIGSALGAALDMLDLPHRCTARAIVNVSGDGRESLWQPAGSSMPRPTPLPLARDRAARLGVMVNGLAITQDEPVLGRYYAENLITGPGAFVMEVRDFDEFREAIIKKLVREVQPAVSAALN